MLDFRSSGLAVRLPLTVVQTSAKANFTYRLLTFNFGSIENVKPVDLIGAHDFAQLLDAGLELLSIQWNPKVVYSAVPDPTTIIRYFDDVTSAEEA